MATYFSKKKNRKKIAKCNSKLCIKYNYSHVWSLYAHSRHFNFSKLLCTRIGGDITIDILSPLHGEREREKRKWCKQKIYLEENRDDCQYNAIAFYMHVLYLDCPFKKKIKSSMI